MIKLNGILPPLPTAFDHQENLALDKFKDNINQLSQYDLAGFLILGSNGELVNLSEQETGMVYGAAREAIPSDKIMLAGTGMQSTGATIRLTKTAADHGADAALVLNPSYYKGLMSREVLVKHFHDVAEAAPIPIIIYNMPANSGLDMDAPTIVNIAQHDNIIGIKDSGGSVIKLGEIKGLVKSEFQILAGSASFLLPALIVGAVGGIVALANIAPEKCIRIYQDFLVGNLSTAQKSQLQAIPINNAVTRQWGVPALKAAMDYRGLYGGIARRPLPPVTDEIRQKVIELIKQHIE